MRVIDTLVLELSLDPARLTRGQNAAIRDLRRFEDQATRSGRNIENEARRTTNSMDVLKRGMVGLIAGYSVAQVANFTKNLWQADAAIARTARTANSTGPAFSQWQNAIKLIGGTAEDATASLVSLSNEIEDLKQGKGGGSFLPLFNRYSIAHTGRDGRTRDPGDILTELQSKIADEMRRTGATPAAMAAQLRTMASGASPHMINLLTQNPAEFNRIMSQAKASAATPEDLAAATRAAEAMEQVAQAGSKLFRVMTTLAEGPLVKLLEWVTRVFGQGGAGFKPELVPGGIADRVRRSSGVRWLRGVIGSVPLFNADGSEVAAAGEVGEEAIKLAARKARQAAQVLMRIKAGAGFDQTHAGTQALGRDLHDIPGFDRITSGNDRYHGGRGKHGQGLALDFSIKDKARSAEAADALRKRLKEMGINATVLDEYARPSPFATGGHIHVQFATEADAARYAASRAPRAGSGAAASATAASSAQGGSSTTSNEVTIGEITINDSSGNSDAIAGGIKKSIEDVGLAASVNSGLQ